MIKIIYGPKGEGKTKQLIDGANRHAEKAKGLSSSPKHMPGVIATFLYSRSISATSILPPIFLPLNVLPYRLSHRPR